MTFSEALKANETNAVRSPTGGHWEIGRMLQAIEKGELRAKTLLTGQWTPVRVPRVLWINEISDGWGVSHYSTKEQAEDASNSFKIRVVKFIEVLDE